MKNPRLRDRSISSREELDEALAILDRQATDIVKTSGRRAFLTTAISQNGALDSLIVLGIQAKLVWDVSHVYLQRPTVHDLTYLYSNVVVTAFLAGEIDDADLSETIQPVLTTVLGSAVSIVPGLQVASSVFVNSVISGSANAFLTLRVGVIAQEYSRAVARPERRVLRRVAIARAAGMLSVVAASSAAKVSAAIARASGRKVTGTISGAGRRMRTTGSALKDRLGLDKDEELANEGDSSTGAP